MEKETRSEVRTGTLVCWKGNFGFIADDLEDNDIFCYGTDLTGRIPVGGRVEYRIGYFRGKPKAVYVRALAENPSEVRS